MTWRNTSWRKRSAEGLRGASLFHLVSHSFANLPGRGVVVLLVVVFGLLLVSVLVLVFVVLVLVFSALKLIVLNRISKKLTDHVSY